MAQQAGTTKKVTVPIGDHMITLQNPGTRWCMEAEERNQHPMSGKILLLPMCEDILEHVVTDPRGLTIDDFNHEDELVELWRQYKSFRRRKNTPIKKAGGND